MANVDFGERVHTAGLGFFSKLMFLVWVVRDKSFKNLTGQINDHNVLERPQKAEIFLQVKFFFFEALRDGLLTTNKAVARLTFSDRALARRLRDSGTTNDELSNKARLAMATNLLSHGAEVQVAAQETGFSTPAAFSKAQKRWSERSPVEELN